jgi:hypothetical protein
MMYGLEKSDSAIRAKKPANKAGQPVAEWAEQRAGTKGNTGQPHTRRTQSRDSVSQGLDRVRHVCRQTPEVGAVCPNWARTDLCGGCPERASLPRCAPSMGANLRVQVPP